MLIVLLVVEGLVVQLGCLIYEWVLVQRVERARVYPLLAMVGLPGPVLRQMGSRDAQVRTVVRWGMGGAGEGGKGKGKGKEKEKGRDRDGMGGRRGRDREGIRGRGRRAGRVPVMLRLGRWARCRRDPYSW